MGKQKFYYDRGNYDNMRKLMDLEWEEEFAACPTDVTKQWEIFKKKFKDAEEICVPQKQITANSLQRTKYNTPLDKKALKKIKKKHRCWQRYMETREGRHYDAYCRQRNQVRALTRKIQKEFEKNIAANAKKNPKKFWQYAKSKTKTKTGVSDLEMPGSDGGNGNRTTQSDKEKAEVLSAFFTSVFTVEPEGEVPTIPPETVKEKLGNITITPEMVAKKLRKINTSKSPGPDKIHPRVLRELCEIICTPIAIIFQTSLDTMELPKEWKNAHVTALFKKGNRKLASNYRPVSLTSIICKTLESIIRDYIIQHMKENKLFSKKQFGFISGRSTTLQLLNVLDKWSKILDEGGCVDVIYMDFMKAFDKVPHKRLLGKLQSYGIQEPVHGWIKAFLSDRSQRVIVNGSPSDWTSVTSGIPQGSVLGPILFVIYINDLPKRVQSDAYLFADDTKIFKTIYKESDCEMLQDDLDYLQGWSDTWLLKFHPDKCKVMQIGNKNREEFKYKLTQNTEQGPKEFPLQYTEDEKDIGVTIDPKLTFEKHMNDKVNKANSVMGVIRRTYEFLDEYTFLQLYKALVRPHVEYANAVWYPYKIKDIEAIENVQRRASRLVPTLKDLSYEERLRKLGLPTLVYRRLRGDMVETYKTLHSVYDPDVATLLTLRGESATRGNSMKLFQSGCRTNLRKYSFALRVVKTWNNLPEEVISAPTLKSFERRLDKHWQNQPIKFNYKTHLTRSDLTQISCSEEDEDDLDTEA